jgi:hypothetical protein
VLLNLLDLLKVAVPACIVYSIMHDCSYTYTQKNQAFQCAALRSCLGIRLQTAKLGIGPEE